VFVITHPGGFVDGSGWEGVYTVLKNQEYSVSGRYRSEGRPADVVPERAAFMADSQVPWGVAALSGVITEPAWKTKPSWCLVSTEHRMIPPAAQRAMSKRAGATVVEVKGSHAVYVSQPQAVASLIQRAAETVGSIATK
jgi:pimeloyl-ACP methyl ester carboxylesterase